MVARAGGRVYVEDVSELLAEIEALKSQRSPVAQVGSITSSSAIGSTETVVLAVPEYTYEAGWAYRIEVTGGVTGSTAGSTYSSWKIRKTNGSGTGDIVVDWPRIGTWPTTSVFALPLQPRYFIVGATDVTTGLDLCLASASGNTTHAAAATYPRTVKVFKMGLAVDFPTEAVLS